MCHNFWSSPALDCHFRQFQDILIWLLSTRAHSSFSLSSVSKIRYTSRWGFWFSSFFQIPAAVVVVLVAFVAAETRSIWYYVGHKMIVSVHFEEVARLSTSRWTTQHSKSIDAHQHKPNKAIIRMPLTRKPTSNIEWILHGTRFDNMQKSIKIPNPEYHQADNHTDTPLSVWMERIA